MPKLMSMIECRWVCVEFGCKNDARYAPSDGEDPRYCAIHDMLLNDSRGVRLDPRYADDRLDKRTRGQMRGLEPTDRGVVAASQVSGLTAASYAVTAEVVDYGEDRKIMAFADRAQRRIENLIEEAKRRG